MRSPPVTGISGVLGKLAARLGAVKVSSAVVPSRSRARRRTHALHRIVLGIVMALAATIAFADALSVAEIGSFHVGGRAVSLPGLPTKDVVFTRRRGADQGGSQRRLRGRADVRAVRQARQPEGALSAAAVARRRAHRRHLGDQARRQAGLADVLPRRRPRRLRLRRGRARARLVGALPGDLHERAAVPHQEGGVGGLFRIGPDGSYELGPGGAGGLAGPAVPDRGVRQFMQAGRAALGRPTTRRSRPPTTRWCRRSARA